MGRGGRARQDDDSEETLKVFSPLREWACGLELASDISFFSLSLRDRRGSVVAVTDSGLGIEGPSNTRPSSTDKGRGRRSSLKFLSECINEEGHRNRGIYVNMYLCLFE